MRRHQTWQRTAIGIVAAVGGMTAGAFGAAFGGLPLGAALAFAAGVGFGLRFRGVTAPAAATTAGLLAASVSSLGNSAATLNCAAVGAGLLGIFWLVRNVHDTWRRGYDEAQRAYERFILPAPLPREPIGARSSPYSVYESRSCQWIRN